MSSNVTLFCRRRQTSALAYYLLHTIHLLCLTARRLLSSFSTSAFFVVLLCENFWNVVVGPLMRLLSSSPCLSGVVSSKRLSSSETTCGSARFVGWLLTFVADGGLQKVPDSAGMLFAASSWLVLRLRLGSSRRETHTQRDNNQLAKESGLYKGPLPNAVH